VDSARATSELGRAVGPSGAGNLCAPLTAARNTNVRNAMESSWRKTILTVARRRQMAVKPSGRLNLEAGTGEALFVEEGGLCGGGEGGFAACDAHYTEHGDFAESGARDEDAVGVGVEVGRSDLDTVVQERQQVVGNDAFKSIAVKEAEAKPQAIELGAAEKCFALGLKIAIEITDKIDGANAGERKLLMLAIVGEKIDRVKLTDARRIEVAAKRFAVLQFDNHLFVGGGWGAEFQGTGFTPKKQICT
jgi:hypothetical protein